MTTDAEIIDLGKKLDRYIFAQRYNGKPPTHGLVIAALGTLLAGKAKSEDEMRRTMADMVSAIRASYYARVNDE